MAGCWRGREAGRRGVRHDPFAPQAGWARRLWSRNAAVLLGRNTVVSIGVFLVGLALLWLLVEVGHVDKLLATGFSFVLATSLHYALGRTWIYRGTARAIGPGYGYFIVNALIGLAITLVIFDALTRYTPIHYLLARVIVSLFAGLAMFLLNASLNFRRL
jgi:putative flippase GtrA